MEQIRTLLLKCEYYLKNLNLFKSVPTSNNEQEVRIQRISTRLFIILLISSMTILLLYNSIITVMKTHTVPTPTLEEYSKLYSTYSQALICPCNKISIKYEKFIGINYTLHQICGKNIFVSHKWHNYFGTLPLNQLHIHDFRARSLNAFQVLNTLCELINSTISDSLIGFYSIQYVSAYITPFDLFKTQAKSYIDQFRLSTTNSFLLSLSMIRNTTHGNGLLSAILTNYLIKIHDGFFIYSSPLIYGNCNCFISSTCIEHSAIYNPLNNAILFIVPGFYTGCYVIDSLLQSNLVCFYNQTCINTLQGYFGPSSPMNMTALDSSSSNEYYPNSTIKELLEKLMIEEWDASIMYNEYYDACDPVQCTYTIKTRNNIIYIITILFGIFGGLVTVLEIIVPRLVRFIRYCIRKLRGRVAPEMSHAQS